MKRKLLCGFTLFLMLGSFSLQAQTQIGADIKGDNGDNLGNAIALSSDGSIMALGYPNNKTNYSTFGQGKAKIFKNNNGTWTQIGTDINGQTANVGLKLGTSIAISADGSIVAIGVPGWSGKTWERNSAGGVQILKNNNGNWTEIGFILGENANDNSGNAVALSADGNIVAIASQSSTGGGIGQSAGQIRVFQNNAGTWTQIGSDINGEASNNNFGRSLAISADGSVIAAGAPLNSNDNGSETGNVRVFKNINNVWTKIGTSILGQSIDYMFGLSVSLSVDGNVVAVGCNRTPAVGSGQPDTNRGATRIYQNVNNDWAQLGNDIPGEVAADASGQSVALSSNGITTTVAIGAPGNSGGGSQAGQVRIFQFDSNDWIKKGVDINGMFTGEQFGSFVALSKDGKVVAGGAPFNSENGQNTYNGKVRVYDLSGVISTLATDTFVAANTSIYPNPVKNNLYINLQEDLNLKEVKIYSVLGQLIKTESSSVINVNSLDKGFYLVQIVTDKGNATHKIIVE